MMICKLFHKDLCRRQKSRVLNMTHIAPSTASQFIDNAERMSVVIPLKFNPRIKFRS